MPDLVKLHKLATEAKTRADAATPGPWEWDGRREENDPDMPGGVFVYHPQGSFLADTAICLSDTYEDDHLDLDFIAAARTDVPALADAVLTLVERVEFVKKIAIAREASIRDLVEELEAARARIAELEGTAPKTESELKQLMRDPRYWRYQEREIVEKVREGFRQLYKGA